MSKIIIESVITQVQLPEGRQESPFDKMLDGLEIGAGLPYVASAKDKEGNPKTPDVKSQYGRAPSSKWAPKGKTFKIIEADDQSGLPDNFHKRFVVVRVPFVEPVKRTKKVAQDQSAD